jgi:LemA protein
LAALSAVIVVLVISLGLWLRHRAAVARAQAAEAAWAPLAVELQRRENLIVPLISIFQAKDKREEALIQAVTEAHARCKTALGQLQEKPADDALARVRLERGILKCEEELGRSLSRLMARSGEYPDLTADKTFQVFREQLKSLEGRIAAARSRFDAAASSL